MPPVSSMGDIKSEINKKINENNVMIFSKKTCPFCLKVFSLEVFASYRSGKNMFKGVANDFEGAETSNYNSVMSMQCSLKYFV